MENGLSFWQYVEAELDLQLFVCTGELEIRVTDQLVHNPPVKESECDFGVE